MASTPNVFSLPSYLFSLERKGIDYLQDPITPIRLGRPEYIPSVKKNWELFLASARKRFIVDNLIIKNGLSLNPSGNVVLEIDDFESELSNILNESGVKARKITSSSFLSTEQPGDTDFVVSHNQIEHLNSWDKAKQLINKSASISKYGMVHQIHSSDDPAFGWDESHNLKFTGNEWDQYFTSWAQSNAHNGWSYLGNHRGAPGRPRNFVFEKDGSLPFYSHYERQAIRKLIAELTVANGISTSRIPLLLLSFGLAKDNPYLLSGLIGGIHALDAIDGHVARKGWGMSPHGPMIDIYADHITEAITMFEFAYDMKVIPKQVPWILTARNISTDLLRFTNALNSQAGTPQHHPHEGFGTVGKAGRAARLRYGLIKALGDMVIPIFPQSGIYISGIHVAESFNRALPVWTSPTSQKIYEDFLNKVLKNKKRA